MTRRAILIEASQVPGQAVLNGAVFDVANLRSYLTSKAGGQWLQSEIVVLNNPTIATARSAILEARTSKYSFVSFSGHGRHVKGMAIDETRILLKDGELSAFELNTGSDRVTVNVDACRDVIFLEGMEKRSLEASHYQMSMVSGDTRHLFDLETERCERGVVFMYSCDLGEGASENSSGGLFTRSLVGVGDGWHEGQRGQVGKVLSVQEAFSSTAYLTTQRMSQQHPQYVPGKRLFHFPFSVWSPPR